MDSLDRIEKQVILRAPVSRVWQAITNSQEFGQWFGIRLKGEFVPGQVITGTFDRQIDEGAIIEYQRKNGISPSRIRQPDDGLVFCTVERMEPPHYFSFRWIPYGIDAEADLTTEPTTLVEFQLDEISEGTRLTIVESGFERVPEHRRDRAFRMNEGGWATQAKQIKNYVEGA